MTPGMANPFSQPGSEIHDIRGGDALIVGQGVRIRGATINNGGEPPLESYNDKYAIESVPTPTSFTYAMKPNPGANADPASGTVQALWQVQECVIENNVIELIPSFMGWGPPVGIISAGQLIQGALVPASGPYVKQDELTTFIEDAATVCLL